MSPPNSQARLLSPQDLLQKIDESICSSRGDIAVIAVQIADVGYFMRKFGSGAVDELTREFAKRLILSMSDGGVFLSTIGLNICSSAE